MSRVSEPGAATVCTLAAQHTTCISPLIARPLSCSDPTMPITIKVRENGPLFITPEDAAQVVLVDHAGNPIEPKPGKGIALCRCGGSVNKPFCDGTHSRIGFKGAEAAQRAADATQKAADATQKAAGLVQEAVLDTVQKATGLVQRAADAVRGDSGTGTGTGSTSGTGSSTGSGTGASGEPDRG